MIRKHIPGRLVIPSPVEDGGTGFSEEQVAGFHAQRRERLTRPNDELAMDRIRQIFEIATAEEIGERLTWYHDALLFCEDLFLNVPAVRTTQHAAGIVAALSPRQSWSENREWPLLL